MRAWLVVAVLLLAAPAQAGWEEGRAAYEAGDFAAALVEFEAVVAEYPDYAPGHYMLGLSLYRLERVGDAVASLERAVELDPEEPNAVLALGTALVALEEYQGALDALRAVAFDSLPENLRPGYARLLATAAVRSGEPGAALEALETVVTERPEDADLWQALGTVRTASGDDVGAFEAFNRALELDSDNAEAARRAARVGLRLAASAPEAADRELWNQWAAELAESAAASDPSPESLVLAGEAWLAAQDFATAADWLGRAAAEDPASALALYLLGRSETALGDLSAARGRFERARELAEAGPLERNIMRSLAFVHQKEGRYEAAAAVYRELGEEARAAEMERLAEIQANNLAVDERVADCLRRWRGLAELRELNRPLEGTPAWGAIEAEERQLVDECAGVLGFAEAPE